MNKMAKSVPMVTGWQMRQAAMAAGTSANGAAKNCPAASKPLISGLRINTHNPWSCGKAIWRRKMDVVLDMRFGSCFIINKKTLGGRFCANARVTKNGTKCKE